ncbi:hypothetical protein HZH68_009060 [Vespula germanica]|uniref:Uncharacterized protein n=1 Tax=Vespula germanica TaxID=30212 RepID=A0A834K048_VESGE|nr:hypothetical protein HZH68_009060 [Vespula germanica]
MKYLKKEKSNHLGLFDEEGCANENPVPEMPTRTGTSFYENSPCTTFFLGGRSGSTEEAITKSLLALSRKENFVKLVILLQSSLSALSRSIERSGRLIEIHEVPRYHETKRDTKYARPLTAFILKASPVFLV